MSNRDIAKLYGESVSRKKFDTISSRFDEAVVSVKLEDGTVSKFTLEDEYAKTLIRQVTIDSGDIISFLNKVMHNGGWGEGQQAAIDSLKKAVISSPYNKSIELIKYIANNKQNLLTLSDIYTDTEVTDFVNIIINKLPEEFRGDDQNLYQLISTIHDTVVPSSSTNVGLGEGTFSIFGTATKGNSGDLQWDGKEVEIKTNGPSNAGAVLGGDRTMIQNVIDDLQELKGGNLQYGGHFYINTLNEILGKLDTIIQSVDQVADKTQIDQLIIDLKQSANSSIFKTHFKKQPMIDAINDIRSVNDLLSSRTKSLKIPKTGKGSTTLYNELRQYIINKIEKLNTRGQNWISQVNTYLALCDTEEEMVLGFSKIRTDGKCDLSRDITNFFKTHDVNNFLPTVNYDNFARLIGTISLLCYKSKIGFDIITAGNDKNKTMIFIDCNKSLQELYDHLATNNLPIMFDLDIDVYEMGASASKAQTVFATAPRIKLL